MASNLTSKLVPNLLKPNNITLTERIIASKRSFHYSHSHGYSFSCSSSSSIQTACTHNILNKNKPTTLFTNVNENDQQRRNFSKRGRKGGATGHHLENLREMAHTEERTKKQNKKNATAAQVLETEDKTQPTDPSTDEKEDEEEETSLPDIKEVKSKMEKALQTMEDNFRRIRGAEPTTELFEVIPVRAYGSYAPLNSIGQVVITSPSLVTITCFDPSISSAVRDAIRDAGYNFNPRTDDDNGTVLVPIPRVSQETRMQIVKALKSKAEKCRIHIRNVRKKYLVVVNLGKQGKLDGVGKDEAFRCLKELDDVTHEVIDVLNKGIEEKEDKIMNV